LVLFEAAAICMHIADHHPEAQLAPRLRSTERSHFYKWLVFLTNTVQAEIMTFHYPENHTDDARHEESVRRVSGERTMEAFAVLERTLGPGSVRAGPAVHGLRRIPLDALSVEPAAPYASRFATAPSRVSGGDCGPTSRPARIRYGRHGSRGFRLERLRNPIRRE
jgi:hypothetical protein